MGWFWADKQQETVNEVVAVHGKGSGCPVKHNISVCPVKHDDVRRCPVKHDDSLWSQLNNNNYNNNNTVKEETRWSWWSWSKSTEKSSEQLTEEPPVWKCPVDHSNRLTEEPPISKCPVDHSKRSWWYSSSAGDEVNPLNNMPSLSSQRAPGQKIDLGIERTQSSIPKGTSEDDGVWEYPSPQQMLNAMIRKGGGEIAEDAVESMVDVHNFLNEGAWDEVLKWEEPYTVESNLKPRLLKFTGRPDDMSPRAQFLQILGRIYPSKYGTLPPFDRHDWTVLRGNKDGEWQEVRYVIDYYAGPDNEEGMPTFILDVRPALDSVSSAVDRFHKLAGNTWSKAMGWEK
jgi:cytochrome c heme-lyase